METLQKPNFKELKENYSGFRFHEIEMLLKTINRLNGEIMENCSKMNGIAKNNDGFHRDDKTIINILANNAENAQNITFEMDMILRVINEKLEPLQDVEDRFYEVERYINS